MLAKAGIEEAEVARLMRSTNERETTEAINKLEADDVRRITPQAFRSFMSTWVRAVPCIRVDREQRQLRLGHLDQDTTAHDEFADLEYLREATAATIREIDKHSARDLWPKPTG